MKFQIDTQEKTVSIIEGGNIKELVRALKGMLGDEYKNYSFNPFTYTYWYSYPWYTWHWKQDPITVAGDTPGSITTTAVYNVDVLNN